MQMQKWILNGAAMALEGVGVYMAAPVAIELWGTLPGLVLSGCLGLAIYYAWFSAINVKFKGMKDWRNWVIRPALLLVALSLLGVSSISIHSAKNLDSIKAEKSEREAKQVEIDARYANALKLRAEQIRRNAEVYQMNEQSRLDSLSRVNAEIKSTKKAEQPGLFEQLLARQAELSIPHIKEPAPVAPKKEELPAPDKMTQADIIEAVQVGGFTIIVPILLLLAKLSGSTNGNAPARSFAQLWTRPVRTKSSNVQNCTHVQFSSGASATTDPDMVIFAENKIEADEFGKVARVAIEDYFNCGRRKAEGLRSQAVKAGLLENRSNCYYYTNHQPVVQVQRTAEIHHLHAVGQ